MLLRRYDCFEFGISGIQTHLKKSSLSVSFLFTKYVLIFSIWFELSMTIAHKVRIGYYLEVSMLETIFFLGRVYFKLQKSPMNSFIFFSVTLLTYFSVPMLCFVMEEGTLQRKFCAAGKKHTWVHRNVNNNIWNLNRTFGLEFLITFLTDKSEITTYLNFEY